MQKRNALYSVSAFRRPDNFVADFSSHACSFVSLHELSTRQRFGLISGVIVLVLHYRRIRMIEKVGVGESFQVSSWPRLKDTEDLMVLVGLRC